MKFMDFVVVIFYLFGGVSDFLLSDWYNKDTDNTLDQVGHILDCLVLMFVADNSLGIGFFNCMFNHLI